MKKVVKKKRGATNEKLNKYGLSRADLTEDIKRQVRQRCGFGCVRCGNAIYQYEHFDPPFEDARAHDPNGITLLCGGCHDQKTRRLIGVNTIRSHDAEPWAKRRGYAKNLFCFDLKFPIVELGEIRMVEVPNILTINGETIMQIKPGREPGEPFLLSATLRNKFGNIVIEIVDNEWKTVNTNWDSIHEGNRIKINSAVGAIDLQIRIEADEGRLIIDRLLMKHRGIEIFAKHNEFTRFTFPSGNILQATAAEIGGFDAGIVINNERAGLAIGGRANSYVRAGKLEFKKS